MSEITRLLQHLDLNDPRALNRLIEVVYQELRVMAAAKMAAEKPDHTLDATGLVHEVFLRLPSDQAFESRRHFFGAASEAMRRILIERARSRGAIKRGAGAKRVDLSANEIPDPAGVDERLEELNLAIDRLAVNSPEKAELVKLRYFVGLTIHEAAKVLGISTATADRRWAFARSWLQAELQRNQ